MYTFLYVLIFIFPRLVKKLNENFDHVIQFSIKYSMKIIKIMLAVIRFRNNEVNKYTAEKDVLTSKLPNPLSLMFQWG